MHRFVIFHKKSSNFAKAKTIGTIQFPVASAVLNLFTSENIAGPDLNLQCLKRVLQRQMMKIFFEMLLLQNNCVEKP